MPWIWYGPIFGLAFRRSASRLAFSWEVVGHTTVTGSFSAGISNETGVLSAVKLTHLILFNNNPDLDGF